MLSEIGQVSAGRVLAFSQWWGVLEVLQGLLILEGVSCVVIGGFTGYCMKVWSLYLFLNSPYFAVLGVSLQVACLGLNLSSARSISIVDPWWNTSMERQAVDRAHRIGQMQSVKVFRLTVTGSVEDDISEVFSLRGD